MMTNISYALKELYRFYLKTNTETDTKRSSLFRVHTGLKSGDWHNDDVVMIGGDGNLGGMAGKWIVLIPVLD